MRVIFRIISKTKDPIYTTQDLNSLFSEESVDAVHDTDIVPHGSDDTVHVMDAVVTMLSDRPIDVFLQDIMENDGALGAVAFDISDPFKLAEVAQAAKGDADAMETAVFDYFDYAAEVNDRSRISFHMSL